MEPLVSTRLRGLSLVAGGAAAVLMSLAPLSPASAGTAPAGPPPGNKGTIKVHRTTTPDTDRRNEPKVCDFRIVGFSFPADAHLEISIEGHGGPNAGAGSFESVVDAADLSPAGDFAIAGPTLPDGMYELTADNTTAPGDAKHKVFKVECPGEVEAGTAGGDTGGTTGGDTSGTTGGDTSGTTGGTTGGDNGGTTGGDTGTTRSDVGAVTTGSDVGAATTGSTGSVLGETLERPARATETEVLGTSVEAGSLPRTGSSADVLTVVGAGMLLTGVGVLVARRRYAHL